MVQLPQEISPEHTPPRRSPGRRTEAVWEETSHKELLRGFRLQYIWDHGLSLGIHCGDNVHIVWVTRLQENVLTRQEMFLRLGFHEAVLVRLKGRVCVQAVSFRAA